MTRTFTLLTKRPHGRTIAALPPVARNDGGGGGALSPCVCAVARFFSSVIARGPQAAVAIHWEPPGGAAPASTRRRCFPSSGLSAPAARRGTSPWIAALPSVA